MKFIKLSNGKSSVVDDWDYLRFGLVKWTFDGRYAVKFITIGGKPKKFYLHRVILNTPKGFDTDHINRDKLDNRRSNLRVVNRSKSEINKPLRSDNKSGYKNVCWDNERQKWLVRIVRNGKALFFKRFLDKEEAYKARQEFLRGC